MKKNVLRIISCLLAVLFLCFAGGCGSNDKPAATDKKNIKIGTLSTLQPFMEYLKDQLVKKGYNVELVMFDANNMPAIATKDGSIDGFIHNHLPWIKTFNTQNNANLKMIEPYLFYYRTAMYSAKYKNVNEFPDGIQIAIPDDPTNIETSLLLLQQNGMLTLGEKHEKFYTLLDIKDNPKHIKFLETEITTTARSYKDAGAIICPATRAKQGGIDPNSFIAEDKTTVNFPVGLTVDAKNEQAQWVKDAVEILKDPATKAKFNELYNGTMVLF